METIIQPNDSPIIKDERFDTRFRVEVLGQMSIPQTLSYMAMHQDYCEESVHSELVSGKIPGETRCGELLVKYLLKNGKGHYGPLEHAQIVLNVIDFPHSFMQQLRTHRVGISFDVQSFRYTGERIVDVANGERELEDVIYIRPVGKYPDRHGNGKILYTEEYRQQDLELCRLNVERYAERYTQGFSPEHARSAIPFDVRQHFVLSGNIRTVMHLEDLRWKANAQLEATYFCPLLHDRFTQWAPQVANWYYESRAKKAILAP